MTSYINNYAIKSGAQIKISPASRKVGEVIFNAFLTSFSDNMTSNWNEEQVYGRPDPIGTFQNTTRKISLAFDAPAANLEEAKENLLAINELKQYLYPTYSSNTGNNASTNALSLAKSPLVRIKFANLIQNHLGDGLLGWIGSFSATPVIDMGMFNEGMMDEAKFYPKVYNISIDFTPQHEFDLGYKTETTVTEAEDGTSTSSTTTKVIDENFTKFPYDGGQ